MPSFQFVVPEGFLFIPANLSFISFCFFISFILSKIIKSNIVFFVLLISLLSVAYYDIAAKYLIRNYYNLTQMDSKVYAEVEKTANNKIESLSMVGVYIYPLKYSNVLTESEKEDIARLHEHYIEKFIDISTFSNKYNRYVYNTERIYLNAYKYTNQEQNKDEKARFVVTKDLKETFFPKFFGKYDYKIIDSQTGIVITKAFNIFFINKYDKFRNKYLYWNQEKEDQFNLAPIQNFDITFKKVFTDNI